MERGKRMTYILKTSQLTKTFKGKEVVSGVNMHVKKGRFMDSWVPMVQVKQPL